MSKHNLKMLIKFQSLWTTLLITVTEYNSNPWCSPCHILLNNNSVPLGRVTSACSSQPFREEKKSLNIGSVARNLCETSNVSWEIASSSFCLVSRFLSLGTPSLVVSAISRVWRGGRKSRGLEESIWFFPFLPFLKSFDCPSSATWHVLASLHAACGRRSWGYGSCIPFCDPTAVPGLTDWCTSCFLHKSCTACISAFL